MSRDPELLLQDIEGACARIIDYTDEMSFEEFREDTKTVDAVARNLAVLGEAVKRLPPEIKARAPSVPWRKIAGFRDVVIHAYFGLDEDILWDLVQKGVPELRAEIQRLLGKG